jgi:hypothetical protein
MLSENTSSRMLNSRQGVEVCDATKALTAVLLPVSKNMYIVPMELFF